MPPYVRFLGIILITTILCAGCSISRREWVHPTKDTQIWYQDKLNCEEYATGLAISMYPVVAPANTVVVNTVVDGEQNQKQSTQKHHDPGQYKREQYKKRLVKDCLYAEGWQYVEVMPAGEPMPGGYHP